MNPKIPLLFPIGHFYSPICDPVELREREAEIWPTPAPSEMPGIALNTAAQLRLLDALAPFVPEISYPYDATQGSPPRYFYSNDQYPCLDAEVLFCMLRHVRPKRVVEIGSGFSSLITAEVNRQFVSGAMEFTCIEPYPRQFLIDGVPGVTSLIRKKIQQMEPSFFDRLGPDDILFIDSSHVAKAGSDVNYLIFEILPRLQPGVLVHIHDIFLPDEYSKRWVIDEGRNWNEQYVVRAFLQYNEVFEVVWSSYYMCTRHAAETAAIFPRFPKYGGGGSLWLRRRH
jgi:predicted O-methyltransferase YrrM